MRNTLVMLSASMLVAAAVGLPGSAHSQVVVIIGNGSAQPYYAQPPYPYPAYPYSAYPYTPYPHPYHRDVLYSYYPAYGYPAAGYYNGYYNGYARPYGYWGW